MMDPRRSDPRCEPLVSLELIIPCGDRCSALLGALRPDDVTAPQWLRITERVEDGILRITITAPGVRVMSIRSTADEILEYAYSLLRLLEKLSAAEGGEEKRSPSRGVDEE